MKHKYFYIIFSEYSGMIPDTYIGTLEELKKHFSIILDDKHYLQSVEECFPDGTTKTVNL